MSDYVQCPNCGGYKVNLEEKLKAQKTEQEKIKANGWGSAIGGMGCASGIGIALLAILAFLTNN